MKMRALNHVNLVVQDVERSADFYRRLFGMEEQWREGDFVFLHCGDTDLALVGGVPAIHRRFHIGFRVYSRAEVDSWRSVVAEEGVEISHGPKEYGGYYTFTCRDPDGYGLEIYYEEAPRGSRGCRHTRLLSCP